MTRIYELRLILCLSEWIMSIDLASIKITVFSKCSYQHPDFLLFLFVSCLPAFYTEICSLETYAGVPSSLGYCCGTLLLQLDFLYTSYTLTHVHEGDPAIWCTGGEIYSNMVIFFWIKETKSPALKNRGSCLRTLECKHIAGKL